MVLYIWKGGGIIYISTIFIKLVFNILFAFVNMSMSAMKKFINFLDNSIRFSVEELKAIQKSDDPFTNEELNVLLDEELSRHPDKMDTDIVDYLVDEID